ncbi:MAG: hypothetical protein LBS50_10550 [Prevotellaceae bacterium]|jgi:hypothetical protein|nr:hypothetical protein [Prevotellaceae bacterium]
MANKNENSAKVTTVTGAQDTTRTAEVKVNPSAETTEKEVVRLQLNSTVTEPQQEQERKLPTLQELKNRAQILYNLQEKHTEFMGKRLELDKFEIMSDNQNATVTIKDVKGKTFTSNNPTTIDEVIKLWKAQFDNAIKETESKIFAQYHFENQQVVELETMRQVA